MPGVTIVANLVAFPAVSPALLLGLVAAAVGLVSVAAGHLLAALALVPMRYLEWVADRLAKAPVGPRHVRRRAARARRRGGVSWSRSRGRCIGDGGRRGR